MKNLKFREIGNNEPFDPSIICINVPFTQASFYGDWQKSLGRKTRRFLVYSDKEIVAYFQLIKYPLLFGKSYLYIPYGPVTEVFSEDFLAALKKELERIAKDDDAVFVRLDFTPPVPSEVLSKFFKKDPLHTSYSGYFQPRLEWYLGLQKSEEDLLKDMHEKTRYSIRLAEKKEITVEIVTKDFVKYFDIFCELMAVTAKRNGFGLHEKKYYKHIFNNLSQIENGYLSIARYGEKILAVHLIIPFGEIANYVYGCSSGDERNRMPTYLAHWKALCYAKQLHCSYYNFGGISDGKSSGKSMENLTIYKKKFGGEEIKHSDFFDVIINPFWYHLYNFRKRIKKIGL